MELTKLNKDTIKDFVLFVKKDLGIKSLVPIKLITKRPDNVKITSAAYVPDTEILIYILGRHLVDILRSIGHELVHHWQMETGKINGEVQDIGGEIEDEANAIAGQLIKKYAKLGHSYIYN